MPYVWADHCFFNVKFNMKKVEINFAVGRKAWVQYVAIQPTPPFATSFCSIRKSHSLNSTSSVMKLPECLA